MHSASIFRVAGLPWNAITNPTQCKRETKATFNAAKNIFHVTWGRVEIVYKIFCDVLSWQNFLPFSCNFPTEVKVFSRLALIRPVKYDFYFFFLLLRAFFVAVTFGIAQLRIVNILSKHRRFFDTSCGWAASTCELARAYVKIQKYGIMRFSFHFHKRSHKKSASR